MFCCVLVQYKHKKYKHWCFFFSICKCLIHSVEVYLCWWQHPRMRWYGENNGGKFSKWPQFKSSRRLWTTTSTNSRSTNWMRRTYYYQGNFTWHYPCFKDYCYQEIIYGPLDGASVSPDKPLPYKGRDPSQAFLFEIVANKSCSIDVDKVWY